MWCCQGYPLRDSTGTPPSATRRAPCTDHCERSTALLQSTELEPREPAPGDYSFFNCCKYCVTAEVKPVSRTFALLAPIPTLPGKETASTRLKSPEHRGVAVGRSRDLIHLHERFVLRRIDSTIAVICQIALFLVPAMLRRQRRSHHGPPARRSAERAQQHLR